MNNFVQYAHKPDLKGLIAACHQATGDPSLAQHLGVSQWDILAPYLQLCPLTAGQVIITQGSKDRAVYFVESGSLSVHYEDDAGRIRLAVVGAGSAVGEGSFFSNLPRSATVQAGSDSKLWCLTSIRFGELTHRQPATALAVAMALGGLVARRMQDRRKRISVT